MGTGFVLQAKRKLEMDSPSQRPTRRRLSSACSSISEELSEYLGGLVEIQPYSHPSLHLRVALF